MLDLYRIIVLIELCITIGNLPFMCHTPVITVTMRY